MPKGRGITRILVKSDEAAGASPDFRDKDYGYNWYNGQSGYQGVAAGTAVTASLLASCSYNYLRLVRP